jgi:hypothetical protein
MLKRAPSTFGAHDQRSRHALVFAWSGGNVTMWREVGTLCGYGSASEFDDDDRRLGHRRIGRHRLGCCPQQDVQMAQSKLVK